MALAHPTKSEDDSDTATTDRASHGKGEKGKATSTSAARKALTKHTSRNQTAGPKHTDQPGEGSQRRSAKREH